MKICPKCGKQYTDDINFCEDCGTRLQAETTMTVKEEQPQVAEIICPSCKKKTPALKYCKYCGKPLPVKTSAVKEPAGTEKPPVKKKKNRIWILPVIVIICGLLAAGGYAVIKYSPALVERVESVLKKDSGEAMEEQTVIEEETEKETKVQTAKETEKQTEKETQAQTEKETVQEETTKADNRAVQYIKYFSMVNASSVLAPSGDYSYDAGKAIDDRTDTAWAEGANGTGVGEWIAFATPDQSLKEICGLRIYGGYQKNNDLRVKNGEPSQIGINFSNGDSMTVDLDLDKEYTEITFEPQKVSGFRITIIRVRPGSTYEDTCISEIKVMGYDDGSDPVTVAETPAQGADADYIFPQSSERYLTDEEVAALDKTLLRYARNEIYARHGRQFNDPELQAYFSSKPWYQGIIPSDQFKDDMLNVYEKQNCQTIKKYE